MTTFGNNLHSQLTDPLVKIHYDNTIDENDTYVIISLVNQRSDCESDTISHQTIKTGGIKSKKYKKRSKHWKRK